MRSLTHFLRLIPTWTLTVLWRSWTSCLRLFGFPSEGNEETERKNTFSAVEDSTLLRWHSRTQKRVGRAKQWDQINNEARVSWGSNFKAKHQRLTDLAFMQLRVARPGRRPSGQPYLHSVYMTNLINRTSDAITCLSLFLSGHSETWHERVKLK